MDPCDYKGHAHTLPKGRLLEASTRTTCNEHVEGLRGMLHSLIALLQKAAVRQEPLVASHSGRERREERKERKGKEKRCSQLRHKRPRTHQERKRRVPSYDESIQGHPKEGRGKRERGKRTKTGVPSYAQASRDTPRRGVYLSVAFRNTPKKEERRRGG